MAKRPASARVVIDNARALIAADKIDEARELLLNEGYIKRLVPAIQKAYIDLIPIHPTLQAVLNEVYAGLEDPDPKVRLAAATRISRELSREKLRNNVRWMRDPRATDPLLNAALDEDDKVSERALGALARLVPPYFPDQRALDVFVAKLHDPKQHVRTNAITGIGGLRQEKALEHLLDLYDRGTDEDRTVIAGSITGLAMETPYSQGQQPIEWSSQGKKMWVSKMIEGLRHPFAGMRRQAANALNYLGDPSAIPALQEARSVETEEDDKFYTAYWMDEAIGSLQKKPS